MDQKRGFLVGEGNIAFPGISLKGAEQEQFCFRLGGNLRRNLSMYWSLTGSIAASLGSFSIRLGS